LRRERIKMRDLIVLLPGITGSVLQKDGKDLWSPSISALVRGFTSLGRNLQQMNLEGDDPEIDDLGDGIRATGLVPDVVLVPGLVKIDVYRKLSETIKGRFDVTEGSLDANVNPYPPMNYFEFAYDWRRDNQVAARWLKNLIDLRLHQWRAYAGGNAKVILLAHSMGGIVARYYLEVMGGWETCKALVTFGTPYRGSPKALDYLVNGCRKYLFDLSSTMRTFTSVYQLLPIYKVVNSQDGCKKVTELKIEGVDPLRAQEALEFHKRIMDQVDSRDKSVSKHSYTTLPVVGTDQPTWQSAELFEGKLTMSENLPPDVDDLLGDGDGTVPYLSAIPHELSESYRNSFYAESHSSLHCNDLALDFVQDQLQDMQITGLGKIRGPQFSSQSRKHSAISLYVEDSYAVGKPIVIRARILEDGKELRDMDKFHEHMSSVEALIASAANPDISVTTAFLQRDREWVLAYKGLPEGIYRLEVRTAKKGPFAPPPVHDLFQVVSM
jgi:lecithin:cholesterol acyltransferase